MDYRHWLWSVLLWVGVIASALAAVADPASLGIPPDWMPYVRLVAFIAAVVGGKLGVSYLPKVEGGAKVLIPFLLVGSLLVTGCAARQYPTLPPETQKQLDATEVAKRINRLMDATIQAEADKAIPTVTARRIITWSVEALKILESYPAGYGPALAQTWRSLKADPTIAGLLAKNPYVSAAAALIDVALAMFQEPMEVVPCWLS